MLINKPSLKIIGTILARNEEDIIASNIEHHINQGITHFIITDNASTDQTRAIVSRYSEVVEIIDEPNLEHRQSEWVSRMARLACKFKPDWIVHLDADEFWCGLNQLRHSNTNAIGSTKMFLHPPRSCTFDLHQLRYYLDFEDCNLPGECKIAHRPDPEITITHGNHGFAGDVKMEFTKNIWRHHYPVRSYNQFVLKAVEGHKALLRRNIICERWQKWYNLFIEDKLGIFYDHICNIWEEMIKLPNIENLVTLLEFWSSSEVINYFKETKLLPAIGEWPRSINA